MAGDGAPDMASLAGDTGECVYSTYVYTPAGRFFLHHTTLWQGERDRIEPVSPDEARQYYEDLPEHDMSYAEAFGEEPEEA